MAMFQSNLNGSYGSHYFLRLYIEETGTNVAANTSTIKYRLTLYFDGSSYYSYTNNTTYGNISAMWEQTNGNIGSLSFSNGIPKEIELMTTTRTVTHNDDGSGVAHGTGSWDTATSRMGSGSVSGEITLTTLPRYTTVTSSERGKTSTSISVNWKTTDARWWTQYSLNGGQWKDAGDTVASDNKSGYYTITGLKPNTKYSVKTRCKRNNSDLWSESNLIYITTYQKTIPTISLNTKTINSIIINASCNVATSSIKYRIKKNGGSYGSYQDSKTFSNLSANTTYVIEVYAVGSASKESGTATLTVTTYNIATLTSYPSFNHGDNEIIKYSNPSNSTINAGIFTTDERTTICSYRSVSGSSYTFSFTISELDTLYKLFSKTSNSLKVRIKLRTTCNGVNYYNSKDVDVIFKGNQRTGHINISGTYKRTKRWININGTWKRCIRWINVNGVWKKCI